MKQTEIENFVKEILSEIQKSSTNELKYRTEIFFSKFGVSIENLGAKTSAMIEGEFSKQNISFWLNKRRIYYLTSYKDSKIVTLKIEEKSKVIEEPTFTKEMSEPTNQPKSKTAIVSYVGPITIDNSVSNIKLYDYQKDSINSLEEKIIKSNIDSFSGILVLPTGGGKTLTAAYFIAQQFLDKNKKVLWIAHRHELLEQAKNTFEKLAYKDILPNQSSFKFRLLSSIHDKPVRIEKDDDIIFSGIGSMNSGIEHLKNNWLKGQNKDLLLVIDEAHHSTAKTYRKLIDELRKEVPNLKILGLTATPIRTAEKEKGLLKKIFPDDIIGNKYDLKSLIRLGILSEPIFEEVKTGFDLGQKLTDEDMVKINKSNFNIESIGDRVANTIAENKERNYLIVDRYIQNKEKYKQTIIFALNRVNAFALDGLFKEKGVKSAYVVSDVKDDFTLVTISNKENKETIEKFRNGDLEVLINVNILTEGTDLPKIQTVFLTRPTISTILMTQMIGRGLRGLKAQGTKEAYIVSFVDDWQDKIAWISPEKLFIDEYGIFDDSDKETKKQLIRLVSISKIEEFAILTNQLIEVEKRKAIENLAFIRRIPKGIYFFKYLSIESEEEKEPQEKICEVLVYDNLEKSYQDFINTLPDFFEDNGLLDNLDNRELEEYAIEFENEFFSGTEKYPAYRIEDIKDIIQYYASKGELPIFTLLSEREKYDIDKIAKEIIDKSLVPLAEKEYIDRIWQSQEIAWNTFFDYNKILFLQEIDLAKRKILYPDFYKPKPTKNTIKGELREYEKMSLSEIRLMDPIYEKWLRDEVYKKFTDKDGFYFSAISGHESKSKNRLKFQIDHIKPMEKGGLTILDNLQVLTRKENLEKGAN